MYNQRWAILLVPLQKKSTFTPRHRVRSACARTQRGWSEPERVCINCLACFVLCRDELQCFWSAQACSCIRPAHGCSWGLQQSLPRESGVFSSLFLSPLLTNTNTYPNKVPLCCFTAHLSQSFMLTGSLSPLPQVGAPAAQYPTGNNSTNPFL